MKRRNAIAVAAPPHVAGIGQHPRGDVTEMLIRDAESGTTSWRANVEAWPSNTLSFLSPNLRTSVDGSS